MTYKPTRLSAEAFEELRTIVESEIKESMSGEEIEEMGIGLLKLFAILLKPKEGVKDKEFSRIVSFRPL